MKRLSLLLSLCIVTLTAFSQTNLAPLFQDGMVLQRNAEVAIWGTDNANTNISIKSSWGEKVKTTTDANGNWTVFVTSNNAGGPYTLYD